MRTRSQSEDPILIVEHLSLRSVLPPIRSLGVLPGPPQVLAYVVCNVMASDFIRLMPVSCIDEDAAFKSFIY